MVRLPGRRGLDVVSRRPDRGQAAGRAIARSGCSSCCSPRAPNALAQARKIAQESARFNLGRITRTMNVPDMALEYLQPRHAGRIRFERARATRRSTARPVVVLRFSEATGPSIIRNLVGRDLLAPRPRLGGAWLRARLFAPSCWSRSASSKGACTVDFGIDPRLGIRVPIKMTERYATTAETIDAVATYSDFRSFTVVDRREDHQAAGPIAIVSRLAAPAPDLHRRRVAPGCSTRSPRSSASTPRRRRSPLDRSASR